MEIGRYKNPISFFLCIDGHHYFSVAYFHEGIHLRDFERAVDLKSLEEGNTPGQSEGKCY